MTNQISKTSSLVFAIFASFILASPNTLATPSLQLDIVSDSTFHDGTSTDSFMASPDGETILTSDDAFTLYAYGNTNTGNGKVTNLLLEHYISIAIITDGTITNDATTDFGSFSFGSNTYTQSNMLFGIPPKESLQTQDAGDLPSHGIFQTLFAEVAFFFIPAQTRSDTNTQNTPGTDPITSPGDDLAYVGFSVDTSGLLAGFELHFDLYNTTMEPDSLDIDRGQFAPPSHDAGTTCCTTSVPEPGTLALLAIGLLGMRRMVKN